ncbi:MAG: hypothetical protein HY703_10390 [Gemmatimonadetes bacterium]|nr:hypothetical protein [Gemmatimonadota bacterium]
MQRSAKARAWRCFDSRESQAIQTQLGSRGTAVCPRCAGFLEARPTTRMRLVLPHGTAGFDVDCRACRRFYAHVCHTPRSRYLLRMKRLAAAILRA